MWIAGYRNSMHKECIRDKTEKGENKNMYKIRV